MSLPALTPGTPWWVAVALIIGVVLGHYFKVLPKLREIRLDGDTALRVTLMARVTALELAREQDRAACDERIERIEARHEAALREMKADFKAMRHERNNLRQAFNFLISRIKRTGDAVLAEIAAEAEEMIARGDQLIALEKGAAAGSFVGRPGDMGEIEQP